mmetsp:Transcript_27443/g.38143  ORF Transcript_27443/g.38143 Transcript_27443/m.38143 type:complete len:298 (+) Transcript_27443:233-1126(+)
MVAVDLLLSCVVIYLVIIEIMTIRTALRTHGLAQVSCYISALSWIPANLMLILVNMSFIPATPGLVSVILMVYMVTGYFLTWTLVHSSLVVLNLNTRNIKILSILAALVPGLLVVQKLALINMQTIFVPTDIIILVELSQIHSGFLMISAAIVLHRRAQRFRMPLGLSRKEAVSSAKAGILLVTGLLMTMSAHVLSYACSYQTQASTSPAILYAIFGSPLLILRGNWELGIELPPKTAAQLLRASGSPVLADDEADIQLHEYIIPDDEKESKSDREDLEAVQDDSPRGKEYNLFCIR